MEEVVWHKLKSQDFSFTFPRGDKCFLVINEYLGFGFPSKPNWWWRFWQRVLLGWKWIDS